MQVVQVRELGVGSLVRIQAVRRAVLEGIDFEAQPVPVLRGVLAACPDYEPVEPDVKHVILQRLPELQGLVAVWS